MSNRGLVVPVDGRRMISTGVGITLVVAGVILRFAVPATFTHGLSTGRRTVSHDGTSSLGSDQSRPGFHPAGC